MKSRAIYLRQYGYADSAYEIGEQSLSSPKENEVLIQVEKSGINFAEILARRNFYPEAPSLPYVPGYEVVGRIIEMNSMIPRIQIGDRVVAAVRFGGYADHVIAQTRTVYRIPETLSSNQALSLVTQGATACHAALNATRIIYTAHEKEFRISGSS